VSPLIVVAAGVCVIAALCIFVLIASLMAAFIFHVGPKLQGTFLALTAADAVRILEAMPTYPSWWHSNVRQPKKPQFVMFARNPLSGLTEYVCGFDPLHQPVTTPDRDAAVRLDLADKYPIKKFLQMAEEYGIELFLVFADRPPRAVGYGLAPDAICEARTLPPRLASGLHPTSRVASWKAPAAIGGSASTQQARTKSGVWTSLSIR